MFEGKYSLRTRTDRRWRGRKWLKTASKVLISKKYRLSLLQISFPCPKKKLTVLNENDLVFLSLPLDGNLQYYF